MIFLLVAITGCSNAASPVEPVKGDPSGQQESSHQLWGIWQFKADPDAGSIDIVPIRMSDVHLNALRFLEPPVKLYLNVENVKFTGNILDCDVTLRHPFLGLTQYTGFDVCGIFITNGSVSGFSDPELRMAGEGDAHLMNPDGLTRWWNPAEFPHEDTMFAYKDGLLGTPYDVAGFNCTLNAYKFFCDDITEPDAPLSSVDPSSRCYFSAGGENVRHYKIKFVQGEFVFNYAIDASWKFPLGTPPWHVPDDFAPGANRVEAWNVNVTEVDNTLWNDGAENGGDLSLLVDVWDHYNAGLNTIKVESPVSFNAVTSDTPVGGGEGYSTYKVDIVDATPSPDSIDLLITIESEAAGYQNLLPGKQVSAYFVSSASVDDEKPGGPTECGTGIHGTPVQTPFLDQSQNIVKFEIGWLVNGPYSGQMLATALDDTLVTIRRYDTDSIGALTGTLFATLPADACPPGPAPYFYAPFLYHMEVEHVTGRVIVVPNGLGINNSFLIYDNQGNLISSESGISVGENRKIVATGSNVNGDLWLLTAAYLGWAYGNQLKLERWAYQAGPPYIAYDPASDLNVDAVIGHYNDKTGEYTYNDDVFDLAILFPEERLFIWQGDWSAGNNGILSAFDLNTGSPPIYRPDLSDDNVLSLPTWLEANDWLKAASGGIWCDHSDSDLDGCRVVVFARTVDPPPYFKSSIARLDRDGKVLNEAVYDNTGCYTIGVNFDPDPTKDFLVFAGYGPNECFMSPPPADW